MFPNPKTHLPSFKVPDTVVSGNTTQILQASIQFQNLLELGIVHQEEWEELDAVSRTRVNTCRSDDELYQELLNARLITSYQAKLLRRGMAVQLTIGQYRILESLGQGGMGLVYLAEHKYLRKQVALKVMSPGIAEDELVLARFFQEARAVAKLQHPNIVFCFDAGRHDFSSHEENVQFYYAMEYICGQDMDKLIRSNGPLSVGCTARLFTQLADALTEAHRHKLIHRDIKPQNLIITHDWKLKLLDFGLAQHPNYNFTCPGAMLGTVGYMAPEQANDPRHVDLRADIFSMGATMYRAVTGTDPYPNTGSPMADLRTRLTAEPTRPSILRPDLPPEFCAIIEKLMRIQPNERYQSASEVAAALAPFYNYGEQQQSTLKPPRLLIFEDDQKRNDPYIARLKQDYEVEIVLPGQLSMERIQGQPYALILLSSTNRQKSDLDTLRQLFKANVESRPLLFLCSNYSNDLDELGSIADHFDDIIRVPFTSNELRSRIQHLLNMRKLSQPSGISHYREEPRLTLQDIELTPFVQIQTQDGLAPVQGASEVLGLLLEELELKPRAYCDRIPQYVLALAGHIELTGEYIQLAEKHFVDSVCHFGMIHDIGIVGVPVELLTQKHKLSTQERMMYQSHVTIGVELILKLMARHPQSLNTLSYALEIVRSHHENWDGTGYPEGLVGSAIPLSARIIGLIATYESLRTRLPHRPALSHHQVLEHFLLDEKDKFDPQLLTAMAKASSEFERIYNSSR